MSRNKANLILGCGVVVLALTALAFWVPNDSATGLIVKQRGRLSIGDAMAPTAALALILVAGLLILFEKGKPAPRITSRNLRFLIAFTGVFFVSLAVMRWAGPAIIWTMGGLGLTEHSYRDLRDTAPWKYAGFVIGGTGLVATLMCMIEGRASWRAVLVGLLAVAALIAVFDLPFPDLLLPPNGDV
ncbi:hypothetical protein [Paracoccus homiensis]|uniref:Tripartite tricarboxylate transporter TctB family protein n=1 Tax=Paracoccus homiensis TaxID=364199 RepID=A0A1I0IB60_9RHOB|nr:hypothetical protein [Paracoccus homiensis]SET94027.1 hypothetical protein SAMN04489858_11553 [Paracoccus homiensis]